MLSRLDKEDREAIYQLIKLAGGIVGGVSGTIVGIFTLDYVYKTWPTPLIDLDQRPIGNAIERPSEAVFENVFKLGLFGGALAGYMAADKICDIAEKKLAVRR